MAVYVDAIQTYSIEQIKPAARHAGRRWAHMTADSDEELHAFAARIGLRRSWFQGHRLPAFRHYDVVPSKRALALRLGAIEVDAGAHFSGRLAADRERLGLTGDGPPAQPRLEGL